MIDHLAIDVEDLEKSGRFYKSALSALGYKQLMDSPEEFGGRLVLGWEDIEKRDLYIGESQKVSPSIHIAFRAKSRCEVDDFYHRALAAGGTDNGKPGLRSKYHDNYYAAYVLDPDGHNIEAVCHEPS